MEVESLSVPAILSHHVLAFVLGSLSFRSDRCRAAVSREHASEFPSSFHVSWSAAGRRGEQEAHGLYSESLTKSGNAFLPLGLHLVLAFW